MRSRSLSSLPEFRTVLRGRAESEPVSGIVEPPLAVADSPVSICHILASALAAHSSSAYLLEKEVLQPVELGRVHACRTVGFCGRLRQNPAGKPDGR